MSILSAAANGAPARPARSYAALCQAVERGSRVPTSSSRHAGGAPLVAFVPFRPEHAAAKPTKTHESVVSGLFEEMDANETAPTAAVEGGVAKKAPKKAKAPKATLSPEEAEKRAYAANKAYKAAVDADPQFRAKLLLSPQGTARGHLKKFVKMLLKISGDRFSIDNWSDEDALKYFVTATKTKGLTPEEQRETLRIAGTPEDVKKSMDARRDAINGIRKSEVARIEGIWDAVATVYLATLKSAPPSPDSDAYLYDTIAEIALRFVADDER